MSKEKKPMEETIELSDEDGETEEKHEEEEDIIENKEPETEVTETSETVKKGRGRPKKERSEKKGRGRPKKISPEIKNEEEQPEEQGVLGGILEVGLNHEKNDLEMSVEDVIEKRGRGRPKKSPVDSEDEDVDNAGESVEKKGRGRPKKNPVDNEDKDVDMAEENVEKKGRGRPKKNAVDIEDKEEAKTEKKRGRTKKHDDTTDKPKTKRQKIKKERSIEPGRLRETPRLSYKDDSSDEEVNKYYEEVIISSDSEADFKLERQLSGKKRPEKREAGALRTRKRMSYKDDSDSDIESGFESDVIVSKKARSGSPAKKGRGRPRKVDLDAKPSGKKRGRKRIHPDTGPYVPTGKPRGRPKGHKNKPRITVGKAEVSEDDVEIIDSDNEEEDEELNVEPSREKKPVAAGKPRGRKRIHPAKGPYVPTGKPRGRPKGYKNKPKTTVGKSSKQAIEDAETEEGNQSEEANDTRDEEERGETLNDKTDISEENEEDIDDKESEESVHSNSEDEESEIKEDSVSAIQASAS